MPSSSDDRSPAPTLVAPRSRPNAPDATAAAKGKESAGDPPKKSKKKLVIAMIVLLALVGLKEKGLVIKPHYTAGHRAPNGQIYELPTTSPFTVTTSDGHLVQTNIALQLTTVASTKELTADEPAMESIVIKILGDATYPELLSPAGRSESAAEMLKDIQTLLGPVDGSVQVSAVYFTGTFVLQ